ncbi:sugar phosphate isomerase/epimerase [Sphingomonas sp. RP10(2022)]|uniref:Sugar phosphate isomerase/epimerase n=1 Tax=Sphingomonas liriopis TaxID=2949094 RepID=A0A9X2HU18_9SPHN|nr:sugar phosphate isomerase/epimerase [Sphingomonas liriopis]
MTDTTPAQLAEVAARTGCAGICPFLHAMPVLPAMPVFDLVHDAGALAATRRAVRDAGVTIDLVYPFTLTGRTNVADFAPALAAAAALGAPLANVLCYDRDPARRIDRLAELSVLAAGYGVGLAIEFYPPSQVGSLASALDTIAALGRSDVGVTLDLLHLTRADEWPRMAARLADPAIRMVQVSDGPRSMPADRIEWEGGIQRWLPGTGDFAIADMLEAIDGAIPVSIEVPQQSAIDAGRPILERAQIAVASMRNMERKR